MFYQINSGTVTYSCISWSGIRRIPWWLLHVQWDCKHALYPLLCSNTFSQIKMFLYNVLAGVDSNLGHAPTLLD